LENQQTWREEHSDLKESLETMEKKIWNIWKKSVRDVIFRVSFSRTFSTQKKSFSSQNLFFTSFIIFLNLLRQGVSTTCAEKIKSTDRP
jgi:hypothetical protein